MRRVGRLRTCLNAHFRLVLMCCCGHLRPAAPRRPPRPHSILAAPPPQALPWWAAADVGEGNVLSALVSADAPSSFFGLVLVRSVFKLQWGA